MTIAIINGPNLNLIGIREPQIYGSRSFEDYLDELRENHPDMEILYCQSNHEGTLIDKVQEYGFNCDGIIINAGGYSHTSIALRDAVAAVKAPVVEVHISDISKREEFRRFSYLTDVCKASFIGYGLQGYELAIQKLIELKLN